MNPTSLNIRRLEGTPSGGPFKSAVVGVAIAAALIVALAAGMRLTMLSLFLVLIPGMTAAFILAAVAMGWIFLLIGRFNRPARYTFATGVLIVVIILELFVLTYWAGQADQAVAAGVAGS